MIEIQLIENKTYVESHYIIEIERIYRLRQDLGINMEGIDTLNHMLKKINRLERELKLLKNRLTIPCLLLSFYQLLLLLIHSQKQHNHHRQLLLP